VPGRAWACLGTYFFGAWIFNIANLGAVADNVVLEQSNCNLARL
jgi:hypothetical protein